MFGPERTAATLVESAKSSVSIRAAELERRQLVSNRLERVNAIILDGSKKTETLRDGVIGPKSLGFTAVQFDFTNNRMSFEF